MEKGSYLGIITESKAQSVMLKEEIMPLIDSSNAKEHSYPVYGRQFKSYKWYKPLIVAVLFLIFYILFALILVAAASFAASHATTPDEFIFTLTRLLDTSYDNMDLANPWQSVMSLGSTFAVAGICHSTRQAVLILFIFKRRMERKGFLAGIADCNPLHLGSCRRR